MLLNPLSSLLLQHVIKDDIYVHQKQCLIQLIKFYQGIHKNKHISHTYLKSKQDKAVIYRWNIEFFSETTLEIKSMSHFASREFENIVHHILGQKCFHCYMFCFLQLWVSFAIVMLGSARGVPAVKGPFGRLGTIRGSTVGLPHPSFSHYLIANVNQVLTQMLGSYKAPTSVPPVHTF